MSIFHQDAPSQTNEFGSSRVAWIGRFAAPLLALVVFAVMHRNEVLTDAAQWTVAVIVLMAVLWMTEAMPLPATALIPIVLFPLTGALTMDETANAYSNQVVFLLLGGFMIGRAMQQWNLHVRFALLIMRFAGPNPTRLIGGMMFATAFLSMWISNTATVVMMLPIGLSVITLVGGLHAQDEPVVNSKRGTALATCLLLAIAYSASIGSIGTLIGTPPNLILKAYAFEHFGIDIGFAQWMAVGIPLVLVFLPITWLVLTRVYPPGDEEIVGGREWIRRQLAELGAFSRGERIVLTVFLATVLAWVLREPLTDWTWFSAEFPWIDNATDASIAVAAALVLFAFPVDAKRGVFALDWEHARGLPWGVLILVGGGLAIAAAVQANDVDTWVGDALAGLGNIPLLALVAVITVTIILLTEVTSNTATAAAMLPILGAVAVAIGVEPMLMLVPATIAASFAFMMPVATPVNAIVFGSGQLRIGQMIRAGAVLNVLGAILITLAAYPLAAWMF